MLHGPDAARYMYAGQGHRVARPFNLRVLLPWVCRDDMKRWRIVWFASWIVAAGGMFWWASDLGAARAVAAVVLCLALPGVLGPPVVRPVGVDLPAMSLAIVAVAALQHGWWPLAVVLIVVAASIKESAPAFAALWAWHPILLVGLVVPAVVSLVRKPEVDPITAQPVLRQVYDHPFRTALMAHHQQWRDAWVMVAPWGACLAALYAPSWQIAAVIVVAYLQLLVATDTVRLLHTAAGPALAVAAVQVLPVEWLPLACVAHVVWWWKVETI